MKKVILLGVVAGLLTVSCTKEANNRKLKVNNGTYQIVWSDEFNGTEIDSSKWSFEIGRGDNGWGNSELQYYKAENSQITDGKLIITAKKEDFNGANYTSSRIITRGKFDFTYGKVEVRAKLPKGQGIWPAIWMLGSNIGSVGWPKCGELDIMELLGHEPNKIYGTAHGPGYSGSSGIGENYTLPSGNFNEEFHIFKTEWDNEGIKWFVDDICYHTLTKSEADSRGGWVFNNDFFILLNLAVGGAWPKNPDSTTTFPQTMEVDYVRVWQKR